MTDMPQDHDYRRDFAVALDQHNPLRDARDQFVIADETIYFDGNSLGRLPKATAGALNTLISEEWGRSLIRSWPSWLQRCVDVGDKLGQVILGVESGQVVVCDSTTINLYKVLDAACELRPDRSTILIEKDNFPTDLYVVQGIAQARGMTVRLIDSDINTGVSTEQLAALLSNDTAVVVLSHVGYRSGALADMVGITEVVHEAGALMIWDLSHSAGSVQIPLEESEADFAVGCTYKYLNGGPGAPAYLYVRRDLLESVRQPIWGWFSQQDQFAMDGVYTPVSGIAKFTTGSPNMLGTTAVGAGLDTIASVGIEAVEQTGQLLTGYALMLAERWLTPLGFTVASPRQASRRGAHLTLHHDAGWQICQAMIARGVVPDFRTPDRVRLGFAPVTTSYTEIWDGFQVIMQIVETGEYKSFPTERAQVT